MMYQEENYYEAIACCKNAMWKVALSILWNEADCADAIQEAVLKGWRFRDQLKDEEKMQAWLMRILVNECRNIQRHIHREKRMEFQRPLKVNPYLAMEIKDILVRMPEKYSSALLLHHVEGYTLDEIAEMQGISAKLVKSRLYHARQYFKRQYEQVG